MILFSGAFVILLVLAIPLFGFTREYVLKGREPVARVNQSTLSLSDYAQLLNLRSYLLNLQISSLQSASGSSSNTDPGQSDPILQYAQQAQASLPSQVIQDWTDDQLIREEAAREGISVAQDDVASAIRSEFVPSSPLDSSTTSPGPDGSIPTPAPTATPISDDQLQARYQNFLKNAGTSDAQYRSLVESDLLRQRVTQRLQDQIQSPAPQVHVQAILVSTKDEASAAMDRLNGGEDFAEVAKDISVDSGSSENGGDLGWVPHGLLDSTLESAAFAASVGQVVGPVDAPTGFYVFRVTERSESRDIEPSTLERIKAQVMSVWLDQANAQSKIETYLTSDKITWAQNQYKRRAASR